MQDELTCPECHRRMRYDFDEGKIKCPACGYAPLDAQSVIARSRPQTTYKRLSHRGEVNVNALTAYNSALHALTQNDPQTARHALERALYFQADFADAHIVMADISDDPAQKRHHLTSVLALDSLNHEALKRLMVLEGRITPEQAAALDQSADPQPTATPVPVPTQTEALLCPVCQGRLSVDEANGRVHCVFCGYIETLAAVAPAPTLDLTRALLQRRAQPVRWIIGSRLLHCNECGAERTLPARKLSERCPFCGTNHVILRDAVQSFEQPEGIIPFVLGRDAALQAIHDHLNQLWQRLANVFNKNRIRHAALDGVYLPFWYFDVLMQVTQTRTYDMSRNYLETPRLPTRLSFDDGVNDLPIPAADQPTAHLLNRLGAYDLRQLQPYAPRLLAKYPAELYTREVDVASLDARSMASQRMRAKHEDPGGEEQSTTISVLSVVKQMHFRLLLLPVWVGMLEEQDGDRRPALVNGQTGKVVLGKVLKPNADR
jgi:uncharacterized protein YbaR (Trm112 family)